MTLILDFVPEFSPEILKIVYVYCSLEQGYAVFGTGMLSDAGKVTDRNSSSEKTSPKK